jgi:tRNA(fMet)-specific endonuclease VapC
VWRELVYGCGRLPAGRRRKALEEHLHGVIARSFPILPYDDVAAETHGKERARLEGIGKTPPFVDGPIAAIAHNQGLTLVTANLDDFRRFDGLEIADWTR